MEKFNLKEALVLNNFSGSILIKKEDLLLKESNGFANRSEQLKNQVDTRFGIASGCKLFTAIAVCQLVEKKLLTFQTKLHECLPISLPDFDTTITIHHLLTHTAGIPDYFDEEEMDDFEELWITTPMYHIRKLTDFLPLFQNQSMKLPVGETFYYNNAGYILLGLVVETISGMTFEEYVTENIFKKANMHDSGYFELDSLPARTALGYVDFPDGTWKTNIYSVPVKGGSDGGAFVSTSDMAKLWDALMNFKLLDETHTKLLLTPYINTDDDFDRFYGYGVYIDQIGDEITKYHVMGYDPGVSFHSAYYPSTGSISVVCSNESEGAFDVFKLIEQQFTR